MGSTRERSPAARYGDLSRKKGKGKRKKEEGRRSFLTFGRSSAVDPRCPSALEGLDVLDAQRHVRERRTGARGFVRSSAVGDDRPLLRVELLEFRDVDPPGRQLRENAHGRDRNRNC